MTQAETYVFAGGGTGGHLFPGMAVAEELCARYPNAKIVFIGSQRGIERDIVLRHSYRHEALPVEPSTTLRRNPVKFFWNNWQARSEAVALLDELDPATVIGLGGFASVPVVWAAHSRRIPTLLLEQNTIPGRATRWLSGRASRICVSFDQTAKHLRTPTNTRTTGNPVSKQIADLHQRSPALRAQDPATLLILGGSQGATAVNEMVIGTIEKLLRSITTADNNGAAALPPRPMAGWTIMHQTGAAQHDDIASRYKAIGLMAETAPFFTGMPQRYAKATLAITRGGATSLAELAVAGLPAIVVPYPNSIGNHQLLNARHYATNGAALIVEQTDAALDRMTTVISEITGDLQRLHAMSEAMSQLAVPQAAEAVVDEIERLAATDNHQRRSA